jgi:hypothetical protein
MSPFVANPWHRLRRCRASAKPRQRNGNEQFSRLASPFSRQIKYAFPTGAHNTNGMLLETHQKSHPSTPSILDIPKKDNAPRHIGQRIPLPLPTPSIFPIKPTALIEALFAVGADDTRAHALARRLVEAPLDERSSVALVLIVRVHGERLKVPALCLRAGPDVVEEGVGALDDVLVDGVGGAVGPDDRGEAGGE